MVKTKYILLNKESDTLYDEYETQLESFYLIFQPIIHILSNSEYEMTCFEILLRTREGDCYPEKLINTYIKSEESNKIFLEWYADQVTKLCQKYPHYLFNLNLHPEQFLLPSTKIFLHALKPFARRICIEITEKSFSEDALNEAKLSELLEFITTLGYKISLDDVGTGRNTLELVSRNIQAIASIKFSLIPFSDTEHLTLKRCIEKWLLLADTNHVCFVVEGIESRKIAECLYELGIIWQQGYYWGKSVEL